MAKRWDNPDKVTYRFFLNSGARWTDGKPVVAQDFVFAWRRLLDPKNKAPFASHLFSLKNARKYHAGDEKDFNAVGVRAISPNELLVTLESPTPYFLQLTSFPSLHPVPSHVVKKHGSEWAKLGSYVSNGPFKLIRSKKSQLILEANPQYWDQAAVKLTRIHAYGIEDPKRALKLYVDGVLDYTGNTPLQHQDIAKWQYTSDFNTQPWFSVNFIRFNTKQPPFDQPIVRRAIAKAIDQDKLTHYIVPGSHRPLRSFVPSGIGDYKPSTMPDYSPEKARAILRDLNYCVPVSGKTQEGCKSFPKITFLVDRNASHTKLALGIQQMLSLELGIRAIDLKVEEFSDYLKTRNALGFNMARSGWLGDYYDPNTFLEIMTSTSTNNQTGWSDSDYDQLIQKAALEKSSKKRMKRLREAEAILMKELPIIPIYNATRNYLLKPYVRGFVDNKQRVLLLKNVHIDRFGGVRKTELSR